MGQLKVKDPNDPLAWLIVPTTGPVGPSGPVGPEGPEGPPSEDIYVGPDEPTLIKPAAELWFDTDDDRIIRPADFPPGGMPGDGLVKKTATDGDVESGAIGRGFVGQIGPSHLTPNMGASVVGGAADTFFTILTGTITIDPTRLYQIWAGIRGINDAGADSNCNITMVAGGFGVFDDYFTVTGPNVGLWGAWCQQVVVVGSKMTATLASVTFTMNAKTSIATRTFYLPRITVIDVGRA